MALWGGTYLRWTLSTLTAPGVPFRYNLQTAAGPVSLVADSYSLSLGSGFITLNRPRVINANGVTLASAARLEARGLQPFNLNESTPKVTISDAVVRVVRNHQGELELQKYLPPAGAQPSTIPFDVRADEIKVQVVDEAGATTWLQSATLTNVQAAGLGGRILGRADWSVANVGEGAVTARLSDRLGSDWRVSTRQASLDRVVAHLIEVIPSLQKSVASKASFTGLKVAGPFELLIRKGGNLEVAGNLSAKVSQGAYGGHQVQNAQFSGLVSQAGATGTFIGQADGVPTTWRGAVTLDQSSKGNIVRSRGLATVKLNDWRSVSANLRKYLPKNFSATGASFKGTVATIGNQVAVNGRASAITARLGADELSHLEVALATDGANLRADLLQGSYRGASLHGAAVANVKSGQLLASLDGSNVDLASVTKRFPSIKPAQIGTVHGRAHVTAAVSGKISDPNVNVRTTGTGTYRPPNHLKLVTMRSFLLDGRLAARHFVLNRGRLTTPGGSAFALGSADIAHPKLNLRVDARGVDLAMLPYDVTGLGLLTGKVTGSFTHPLFTGSAEAYDVRVSGQELSVLRADVTANKEHVTLDGVQALEGVSLIEGNLALQLKDQAISGELSSTGIELADFLGDTYSGSVGVHTTSLSGTLSKPVVFAQATASNLFAQGIPIDSLSANFHLADKKVVLDHGSMKALEGEVSGSGTYDLDTHAGNGLATASNLAIGDLLTALNVDPQTVVVGRVGGSAQVAIADNKLVSASASGDLKEIGLNGTAIGSGVWSLSGHGDELSGSAQAGSGITFLAIENGKVNRVTHDVSGDLVASNVRVHDLAVAAMPYLDQAPDSLRNRLPGLDGDINASISLGGQWEKPSVKLDPLDITNIKIDGLPFGSLSLAGSRTDKTWMVDKLNYKDGTATITGQGAVTEGGRSALDGEIANLDLNKLSKLFPSSPQLKGLAGASFSVTGSTDHPHLRASLNASAVGLGGQATTFGLSLDTIEADGTALTASGDLSYRGLVGNLSARIPMSGPWALATDQTSLGTLTLKRRPLDDLAEFIPALDPGQTDGTVSGEIALSGPLNALVPSGHVDINASQMGFKLGDQAATTSLKEVSLIGKLSPQDVALALTAKSSKGGSVAGNMTTPTPALGDLLSELGSGIQALLDRPVSGQLAWQDFAVSERNRQIDAALTLGGGLKFAGSIGNPEISGDLIASNVRSNIPTLGDQPSGQGSFPIDPSFNVNLKLNGPARLTNSLARVDLLGSGTLKGTLSSPEAKANLSLASGELRLPGGNVVLQPGGRLTGNFGTQPDGSNGASLNAELTGESHVSALNPAGTPERYDVFLDIRGDLLTPDKVAFSATSSPQDLSQDQILALLGRTDILTALGSASRDSSGSQRLQSALAGYALPTLADPFTRAIAQSIGLDYLNLEYSALGQTTVSAGKTLSHGFSIQIRRELSEPLPGFRRYYDYRLVFRPPIRALLSRRVSFYIGADQDRTWKLAIEYNVRF